MNYVVDVFIVVAAITGALSGVWGTLVKTSLANDALMKFSGKPFSKILSRSTFCQNDSSRRF